MSEGENEQDGVTRAGAAASQTGAQPRSFYEAIGQSVHVAAGDFANQVIGAISRVDLAEQYSAPINGALARQYIKGRTIAQERLAQGKDSNDLSNLTGDEATAVKAYQKVHADLPAKIPYIDRDALVRQVEHNIEIKAKQKNDPDHSTAQPIDKSSVAPRTTSPPEARVQIQPPNKPQNTPSAKSQTSLPDKSPAAPTAKSQVAPATKSQGAPSAPKDVTPKDVAPKDLAAKAPGTTAPKATPSKADTAPVDKNTVAHNDGAAGSRGTTPSTRSSPNEHSTRQSTDKADKDRAEIKSISPGYALATASGKQSPPKPYEPNAPELKGRTANAPDSINQKIVPSPNQSAKLDGANTQSRVLDPTQVNAAGRGLQDGPSFVGKAIDATDRPNNLGGRSTPLLSASDKTSAAAKGIPLDFVNRLISLMDKRIQTSAGDSSVAQNVMSRNDGVWIKRIDSKLLQVVTSLQALPFGRNFGPAERVTTLASKDTALNVRPGDKSAGSAGPAGGSILTDKGRPTSPATSSHSVESHTSMSGLHPPDTRAGKADSHSPPGADSTTEMPGVVKSQPAATSESQIGKQNAGHGDRQQADHGPSHTSDHSSHQSPDHSPTAPNNPDHKSDVAGSNNTTGNVRVVDTRGAEVSPFGKDKDDFHESERESEKESGNESGKQSGKESEKDSKSKLGSESGKSSEGVQKTYVVKGLIPDKRYITGGELAFVAIMALAGAARVRPGENATEQGLSQTRREYILVEEDPWFNPDYILEAQSPTENKSSGSLNVETGKSKMEEGTEVEVATTTQARKEAPQRKVLLRPQILVQEGDDLSEMAEALFNDCRYGHLIADINAKSIDQIYIQDKRIIRLSTRQRLSLPVHQDVTQYDMIMLDKVGGSPLITIVETTAIDKELLDEGLSSMLGLKNKNRDPLQ